MGLANELLRLHEDGELYPSVAAQYLLQSYGDRNWKEAVGRLRQYLAQRHQDRLKATQDYRRTISFAVLLPGLQKSMKPNREDSEILFRCRYFHSYNEKDWHKNLCKIAGKDLEIYNKRTDILNQGAITNPEYQPYTRQAYNRLCRLAEETSAVSEKNRSAVYKRHKKFVQVYGGAVINSVFSEYENDLDKVINWVTPYFFEHLIHQQYSFDHIIKVKNAELSKTSDSLIQHIE